MKKLYLLRHAKSDWNAPCDRDHERPLAPRGVRAARLMGRYLTAIGQPPDALLTSSAVRARTTVELAAEAGGWKCPLRATRNLYQGPAEAVLEEIAGADDGHRSLLVVGHEPTWSELAALLVGGGRLGMVTAQLMRIDLEIEHWAAIAAGSGVLAWTVTPKLLKRAGWRG